MTDKRQASYLTKFLCLKCHKTFKRKVAGCSVRKCPDCEGEAIRMGHKFRPPPLSASKEWEIVDYLVQNGHYYHSIPVTDERGRHIGNVEYPKSMEAAKVFVRENAEWSHSLDELRNQEITMGR